MFSFLVLGEQPSGPAGGWHGMIDALEMYTTGKKFELGAPLDAQGRPPAGSYLDDLMKFYVGYMSDHSRWLELMKAKKREADKQ